MGDQIIQVGNVCPTKTRSNPNQGRVYDPQGISPTLSCMGGGATLSHTLLFTMITIGGSSQTRLA